MTKVTITHEQHSPLLEQGGVNFTTGGYAPYDKVVTKLIANEVYIEGATTRLTALCCEQDGPRAVLNPPKRLAGGYGSECDRCSATLKSQKHSFRDYQARLVKPFAARKRSSTVPP
jgi:hypothetical protein